MRIIFHIDVNNAFLSWTAVDLLNKGSKYDIRNSYAVIGGDESARRGIVLAKSNPCKKLGIYTSETLFSAKKKCPVLKIYQPDYNLYSLMSNKLFELISNYTNDIEVASIDECYLDYGKIKMLYGDEIEFAYKLKEEIYSKLGFTVNIGIANNKLCAKMASDFSKPNKVHTLFEGEIKDKLHKLDVSDLHGIGKKTSEKLKELNINTASDLADFDIERLNIFFKNQSEHLKNIANGIDDSELVLYRELDSISHEVTLNKDIEDKLELKKYILKLSEMVGSRLRKKNKYANVVCVIIKDNFFKRKTHQKKLLNTINSDDEIYKVALSILDEMSIEKVRLIGVRLDKLTEKLYHQPSLFEEIKESEIDKTLDLIKKKFGNDVIGKASIKDMKMRKDK